MIYCASFMALEDNRSYSEDIQKTIILERSPTLKYILAGNVLQDHLNNTYFDIQTKIMQSHEGRRSKELAREILEMDINFITELFITDNFVDAVRIENDDNAKRAVTRASETLLYSGVQIGSINGTELFLDDIAHYLENYDMDVKGKFFSEDGLEILKVKDGKEKLKQTINKALLLGVYLRNYTTNLPTQEDYQAPTQLEEKTFEPDAEASSPDSLPNPIEDWIEGINFDGLGNDE